MAVCPPDQPAPPPNPISLGKLRNKKNVLRWEEPGGVTQRRGGGGKRAGQGLEGGAEVGEGKGSRVGLRIWKRARAGWW